MGSKSVTTNPSLFFSTLIFLVLMFGLAYSDVNQDKAECTDKLLILANCLPFVTGQAKSPNIDCCTGVKDVINNSKRCLCILIKDHDDPNLGLKINVTLALQLPNDCKTPTNITKCVGILHLPPKSPEAKIFEDIQNSMEKNSSTAVPPASNSTGKGTSTRGQEKNGGGWRKRWLMAEVLCWISASLLISSVFIV
ncbi:non-specific lipid transfer protein GPI-anchored 6-like [Cicer arietinum]|uniref:Protein YLS3-like n=1 Tax=Cicer arietinum TaxID=3827 RepID=A0A1S2YG82_CICAR|nr:protein YLS3-like [Cicer arietinum]